MSTNSPNEPGQAPEQAKSSDSPPSTEPVRGESTAAAKLRKEIDSKKKNLDDFEPEEELWTGGFSPKAMIGTWILLGVISVALLVFGAQIGWTIALGAIVVVWVIGGLWYAARRLGVHYQLTSQRFIHQVGILTRKTDRIEVIDIDDVSFSQGPIQRIFGVGTIVLTGSDRTHPTLSMIGIGDVREVAGLIDDVRRQERRRRSLHIESI